MRISFFSEFTSKQSKFLPGVVAILFVMAIYAANFVVTRYSVLNGLTSFDLAALRFSVAGLLMLPYFYRLGLTDLGGIGWPRAILLSCLAGSPYMLVFFYGLSFAPASHGAVLNPGTLIAVPLLGEIPTSLQWIGIILVVLGMVSAAKMNSE